MECQRVAYSMQKEQEKEIGKKDLEQLQRGSQKEGDEHLSQVESQRNTISSKGSASNSNR